MRTLILNSTNIVNDGFGNTLKYNFPNGGVRLTNKKIGVCTVQMYYSFFNIDGSAYGNNTLSYRWFDNQTYQIIIPDGFYTVEQLNTYLQFVFVANKHYMVNSTTGGFVYFAELVTNAQYYNIQLNCYPLSASSATLNTWILPDLANWTIPTVSIVPQITINSNFGLIIGFNNGTYPSNNTSAVIYSKISDIAPQVSPVNSLLISCSLVNSPYGIPTNILHSFSPNAQFGSLITSSSTQFAMNDISDGFYNDFTIRILDQDGKNIKIRDKSIVIVLVIE